jgi:hypothetical protein
MKPWESLIDKKIREAMEEGEFDDLQGRGQPIDLSENPYEDPDWRTAHRLLRNAGFAPAWIEERKDIDAEVDVAIGRLRQAWRILQNARGSGHEAGATRRWETAQAEFTAAAAELNRRINTWNLKAPASGFQRRRIDPAQEIERIRS